jgi:hypothetical protein
MLRLISVEPGLEAVKNHLHAKGYEVIDMSQGIRPVEAVIYNGQPLASGNMAVHPNAESTVLINAAGLTPEEVAGQLENRLN